MLRRRITCLVVSAVVGWSVASLRAAEEAAAPVSSLARMPIKEITVFKDGHAFVMHQGAMPTDAQGNIVMDYLPTPVLGTFWPYSNEKAASLVGVTAGRRRVKIDRTAITLRDLIEANPGADVVVTEEKDRQFPASIVSILSRSTDELIANAAGELGEVVPQKGNLLLLNTTEGTRAMPVERVQDIKFVKKYQTKITEEEYRNLLTLKLDWQGKPPAKSAQVGMAYLQKGVRWIPHYRVELDNNGKATVALQATLLNELTDLENATVHLVVGVPSFHFKDMTDPIALSQTLAQLSSFFQADANLQGNFPMQQSLSNGLMTQVAAVAPMRQAPAAGGGAELGADVAGEKSEDLYVYTVKNVTLKRGQRQVLPIAKFTLDYHDTYVLNVPYMPPSDLRYSSNVPPQAVDMIKAANAPKVMHKVRLANRSEMPLTTAPVLVVKENRVLAQSTMTYTPRGGSVDISLTTAIDVKVRKTDKETKRTPNAASFNNESFWRIDLAGTLQLTNLRNTPIEIEVVRHVLGNTGEANQEGRAEMVNALEDDDYVPQGRPTWWGYYSWPHWWFHFNGVGRFKWEKKIEPGKSIDLNYSWHHYWR